MCVVPLILYIDHLLDILVYRGCVAIGLIQSQSVGVSLSLG